MPITVQPALVAIDRQRQSWWNWDDYCREVVWYGNKKGAYLYDHQTIPARADVDFVPAATACEGADAQLAGIY